MSRLKAEVLRYGVVRIPKQHLKLDQILTFAAKVGQILVLPEAFRGDHVLPGYPEITPVSTHWENGTWKGLSHSFGQAWHKDYDFVPFKQGMSICWLRMRSVSEENS